MLNTGKHRIHGHFIFKPTDTQESENLRKANVFFISYFCPQLSRKAPLKGNKLIKTIRLPRRNNNLKENKTCRVAGWGATESEGENVDELQVVDVPIINKDRCQNLWHHMLPANVICAGGYFGKQGICQVMGFLLFHIKYGINIIIISMLSLPYSSLQGDSGGPLVCDKLAVGVVSFNNQNICDYLDVPNIYTEISQFLSWIKPILKKKTCEV